MAPVADSATKGRGGGLALVLLLGLAILLNYIDRGAIAIAAPQLKPELGLTRPASVCRLGVLLDLCPASVR